MSTVLLPLHGRAAARVIRCGTLDVEVYHHIDDVAAAEWDAVVGPHELQATHAFIRACQDADVEHVVYRHLVVRRGGCAIGVASVFRMAINLELLCSGSARTAIRAARRLGRTFLRPHLLLCGLPVSAGRPCIAWRDSDDAALVTHAVAAALEDIAEELDTDLLCFKEFDAHEARTADCLLQRGYFRAHSLPSFHLRLPWRSFDGYVAAMRAGYRRQLLRTLAQREPHRLSFRTVADYEPECTRFFPLYEQVMQRAEFQLERLNLAFFRNVARNLGAHTRAILAEREGRLVAGAILLETPRLTTFFMAGLDYEHNRRDSVYLNLVAEVVRDAIRARTGALELGQTSPLLKTRLGAAGTPRFIYFRYRSRLPHALFRATVDLLFPPPRLPRRRVFHDHPATSSTVPPVAAVPDRSPS